HDQAELPGGERERDDPHGDSGRDQGVPGGRRPVLWRSSQHVPTTELPLSAFLYHHAMRPQPDVELLGVRKSYGDVHAVRDVDLEVGMGEFFTMLGPSGSGKTTSLRLIAGFEQPDAGAVRLAGVDITHRPPYARDVNTVFQDYALFPHMTVADNVGYGLRVKGTGRAERSRA